VPPDDYIHCNITQKQDWIDLYATPYYFGCEADDRMNAVAFGKAMPLGARITRIYSSDIGHFDVVDMRTRCRRRSTGRGRPHHESDFTISSSAMRRLWAHRTRLLRGHGGGQRSSAVVEAGRDPARRGEISLERGRLAPHFLLTLMAGPPPAMSILGVGRPARPNDGYCSRFAKTLDQIR